jgi:hypothetical protein
MRTTESTPQHSKPRASYTERCGEEAGARGGEVSEGQSLPGRYGRHGQRGMGGMGKEANKANTADTQVDCRPNRP